MDAATSEQRSDDFLFFERLDGFLETLEAQGLVVDIEQRVRLSGFLLQLSLQQRFPQDLAKLCCLITPILAGSSKEQALCVATRSAERPGKTGETPESASGPTPNDSRTCEPCEATTN
jgi:hypothetical protein